jgi:hypothetical protein
VHLETAADSTTTTPKKKGQTGHWTKSEDDLIIAKCKAKVPWKELTELINDSRRRHGAATKSVNAVQQRYFKALRGRDLELGEFEV